MPNRVSDPTVLFFSRFFAPFPAFIVWDAEDLLTGFFIRIYDHRMPEMMAEFAETANFAAF